MTLKDFFELLAANPALIIAYFILIPLLAILTAVWSGNRGHLSPSKYIYATLIYLTTVPGIFAITLSIYFFLFERRSILQTDIYTQILPVLSMVVTIFIIRKSVSLEQIPGFERLSGLIILITALLSIMWFIDRLRLVAFTYVPFQYIIVGFFILLIAIRFGWKRLAKS
ncbi:MAG: hypothetical protein AAF738_11855 [Bacteroidota bacterium]